MRRVAASIAACAAAFGVLAGGATANHSGPEDVAKGRGATESTISIGNASITGVTCNPDTFIPLTPGDVCVVHSTITTAQSFDFDARLSSQEASSPLGEPHGHMKLSVSITHTNVVTGATSAQSFSATAEVTCLTVVNNKATLSGRVIRFEGQGFTPQRGLFFDVTDNTIARQQVVRDQFSGGQLPEALQACPPPTSGGPITKGDILVEDN